MTYPLAMFILGIAVGQLMLIVVGMVLHRAKERREYESRGRFQTAVKLEPGWWQANEEALMHTLRNTKGPLQ